jgi:hypothetical protein
MKVGQSSGRYTHNLKNFLRAVAARYDGKPYRYIKVGTIGDWGL